MKKFLRENYKLILWLILAGFGMTSLWYSPLNHPIGTFFRLGSFTTCLWIFLWIGNEYTSHWVSTRISWTKTPAKRFWVGILVMLVYSLTVIFFMVLFFDLALDFHVGDDLDNVIYSSLFITFVISLFMHSRGFLSNWREAAVNAEKLQKESITAQYESLKNQVNPHFLFNSLNALTNLVYEDPDKAAKFIKQLSEVYRYVLDTSNKEVVPLEDEIKFLRAYIFLQQIRFGARMKLEMDLDQVQSQVAPLVLQMLIENAIKHNVISEDHPLTIKLFLEDRWIVVENSVHIKNVLPVDSPGIGLENIKRRYGFLSDRKVEVVETGSRFVVRLPVL